jgi:hypothetical protein
MSKENVEIAKRGTDALNRLDLCALCGSARGGRGRGA